MLIDKKLAAEWAQNNGLGFVAKEILEQFADYVISRTDLPAAVEEITLLRAEVETAMQAAAACAKDATTLRQQLFEMRRRSIDGFVDNLLGALRERGVNCDNWDGDGPEFVIIADGVAAALQQANAASGVMEWIERNGSAEYIYEEGRPEKPVAVIRLKEWHQDPIESDSVTAAVTAAMEGSRTK